MTLKRFIRDFALLLGFCGAFYFLTVMMSRLDKDPVDNSDFSATRKRADVSRRNHDWQSASAGYRRLAEKDPYNGHAWFWCAKSYDNQRAEVYQALQAALADAEAQESSGSAGTSGPVDDLRAERERLTDLAKNAFQKAKEFARYRADSLLYLAAIESYEGNNTASLDYLDQFVSSGEHTSRGLGRYRAFGIGGPEYASPAAPDGNANVRLHAEPKFWEIVRKELFNQSR